VGLEKSAFGGVWGQALGFVLVRLRQKCLELL
jgi:hypothetical protein